MDKNGIEDAKAAVTEINELVIKIDPSIRVAAFEALWPYYFEKKQIREKMGAPETETEKDEEDQPGPSGIADFISLYDHKKPADNVMLLAAWLYSTYGVYPITAKEVKELGDACGLIVPNRPDQTMRQAKSAGKSLFSQQGKGWQVTVSGEIFFKDQYKVKKGTKPAPKD